MNPGFTVSSQVGAECLVSIYGRHLPNFPPLFVHIGAEVRIFTIKLTIE